MITGYDRKAQASRRRKIQCKICEVTHDLFNEDGKWSGGMQFQKPSIRENCWHCLALLDGTEENIEKANSILESSIPDANDFMAFFGALLLRLHEEKLSSAATSMLLKSIEINMEHVRKHLFRYTENCSALNCFALLEAARIFNRPEYVARVEDRLGAYENQFARSGTTVEYVSVNYLPVTLNGFAILAEYADQPEIRKAARKLEEHAWREQAACWHPNIGFTAGPSGRSYTADSLAGAVMIRNLVWLVLGDKACPSPMDMGLFDDQPGCPLKGHDPVMNMAELSWVTATPYHIPAKYAELFYKKEYPWEMRSSVCLPTSREYEKVDATKIDVEAIGGWRSGELGFVPSTILHPGGRAAITANLAEDYGIGTSSRILWTQSDFLFAIWRRTPNVERPPDIRTLYTRYVVNDALEEKFGPERFADLLPEQGRGGAAQDGPLAVAWYAAGEVLTTAISKLRTCVILPEFHAPISELWIGKRTCASLTGTSDHQEWVFVNDGTTYLAIRPLTLTNHGRKHAVEIKKVGRFRVVTGVNYDGPQRDFMPSALRQTAGGCAVALGSEREFGSFSNFSSSFDNASIEDIIYQSSRRLKVHWNGRSVDLLWDLQTEDLLFARNSRGYLNETLPKCEMGKVHMKKDKSH